MMIFVKKFKNLREFMLWAFNYVITAHTLDELRTRYERSVNLLARIWVESDGAVDLLTAEAAARVLNETHDLRKEILKSE